METYSSNRSVALGLEKSVRREEFLYIYRAFGWKLEFGLKYILGKLRLRPRIDRNETDFKQGTEGWNVNIKALASILKLQKSKIYPCLSSSCPMPQTSLIKRKISIK